MSETLAVIAFFALFLLALWVGATIFQGAVSTWVDWGPVVLLGWIFAFPFMLIICFLVGLSPPSLWTRGFSIKSAPPSAPASRARDPQLSGAGWFEKGLEKAKKAEALETSGVELVRFYEDRVTEERRSRYDFRNWAIKLKSDSGSFVGGRYIKHFEDEYVPSPCAKQWKSGSPAARESFIKRLDYPEHVQGDLELAIALSFSEAEFKANYTELITAFNGVYTKKPEWIRQEEEEREREQKRREIRGRLRPPDD